MADRLNFCFKELFVCDVQTYDVGAKDPFNGLKDASIAVGGSGIRGMVSDIGGITGNTVNLVYIINTVYNCTSISGNVE
ncbi:hypothetical protein ORI89_17455 [Sphingobacterium sp. UT-1RO-CII-1]|uniref:hypothetical protein n=1 Tax=Sphingobacterium sp. UT-1RO-CII-1 TaxID=2995225 RepID=UPI00227ABC2E|nr:hypothetical protein [Sphingobacterium sp. UT-1RO-CII-1]MCY4781450.1 hypothetical protein [Sphingobacterium sp. UT-1RO-CII-1]